MMSVMMPQKIPNPVAWRSVSLPPYRAKDRNHLTLKTKPIVLEMRKAVNAMTTSAKTICRMRTAIKPFGMGTMWPILKE
jgi:hypothetical protein